MARPREFDEKKALNDALELFWEKGFEATSIGDLTSKIGINRPSLYAAFGDKRELFLLAIDTYQQNYLDKLQNIVASNGFGYSGIKAAFIRFVESSRNQTAKRGCFFINSIVELAANDELIASKGREFGAKISEIFADALEKDGFQKRMNVQSISDFLTMSLIGLNVVVKASPSTNLVENSVQTVLSVLE